jgi:hypothetical protein
MKSREIQEMLQTESIPPKFMHVLLAMNERLEQNNKQLLELATMFDQMVDTINNFMQVASNMKGALDSMQQIDPDDGAGDVTQ